MPHAAAGILLEINLTTGSIGHTQIPESLKNQYIGGKGFGARLLMDRVLPGMDPLSPDNLLMFLTGPLTGTLAPAMRGCVVTRSPLTGLFLDSYFGGTFAPEIRYAGYEGIVITGRADHPVYVWIDDDAVVIRDARDLAGLDILETGCRIKAALGDETVKIAAIGPAGENKVPFALIGCEFNRQAGRGGAGAVMGAKNLKAIAIRGTRTLSVYDPQEFDQACRTAVAELAASEDVNALRLAGTASSVDFANVAGLLPHKNFQFSTWEHASRLSDKGQARHLWLGVNACPGCPIGCAKTGVVRTGTYKGTFTDIVEYESATLMGTNLGIPDIRAVAHLVRLCDRLGLDTMSCGNVIGFAMEACEKGLMTPPDGVDLRFGSVAGAEYLIHAMALQQSDLGILLSRGVREAAREIGGSAPDFAQHTKGLETPAWGPRGVAGMGLAYMTADRGGCHQRGFTVSHELAGQWQGQPLDPLSPHHKAGMVIHLQNYSAGTDTLVKCDFGSFGISPETYAVLLSAASGRTVTPETLMTTGERIWNLTRIFNLTHGMDPADDTLPQRFVREPLPDGPARGHRISPEDMAFMKQAYYAARGWSDSGIPLPATLERLDITEEMKGIFAP